MPFRTNTFETFSYASNIVGLQINYGQTNVDMFRPLNASVASPDTFVRRPVS